MFKQCQEASDNENANETFEETNLTSSDKDAFLKDLVKSSMPTSINI